ncbi:hypothetical protein [Bradyrhizobium pachyrhizi]|uniref:hypothetical protein n=1 Tax=Bradyrhizobium pachyrhizi TaxID=280333 RepID=UPI0012E3ED50|nr:hypothetical protein [Bradyrhizobium pachyrhizi]
MDKASERVSVIAAAIACIGAVASAFIPALYTYSSRDKELDIELVKIGVGILRADPKEAQTNGAREWAVDIIEQYSRRRFSPRARSELLQYQLNYAGYTDYSPFDCTYNPGGKVTCSYPSGITPPSKQAPPPH